MDGLSFRSPIAKFALALWLGCMQWPLAIPLVITLLLVCYNRKLCAVTCCAVALFGLGWTGSEIQNTLNPTVLAPKTSIWTCRSSQENKSERPCLHCTNKAGKSYTAEASASAPLNTPFLGTLWPFRTESWRQFNHNKGVYGIIRSTIPSLHPPAKNLERPAHENGLWTYLCAHYTGMVPGLLQAVFSGNKRHLDAQIKILFAHAGLAHLMAVSGYHVGLVTFPFLVLLRHRRSAFRLLGLTGLIVTWLFIAFCGFPTSAVRAGLMITGYGISQLMRLNVSALQLLGIAAWGMLIYNPMWARDLGMQLSFVAVYAILLGLLLVNDHQNRNPLLSYFMVPIAAQVGTGFIAWPTFGLFPKYFLPFNVLASPTMALLGAAFTCSIGAEFVLGWEPVAAWANKAINDALHCVLDLLDDGHSISWTWNLRSVDGPLLMALSLGYLIGGTLVVSRRLTRHLFMIMLCGLYAAVLPWMVWQSNTRISLSYRYGLVLDAASSSYASMLSDGRDSTRLISHHAKYGVTLAQNPPLFPTPSAVISPETWFIAPTAHVGIGMLKSRPIAWKRMDGSTMLFKFGLDTIRLARWEHPTYLN